MTTLKLMSNVFKILKREVPYKDFIDGDVYMGSRPLNSSSNDIVIGTLALPDDIVSRGTVLINIYANNLKTNSASKPNFRLLTDLAEAIIPVFKDVYYPEIRTEFSIEWTRDYAVEGSQEWVYVIRLNANILTN